MVESWELKEEDEIEDDYGEEEEAKGKARGNSLQPLETIFEDVQEYHDVPPNQAKKEDRPKTKHGRDGLRVTQNKGKDAENFLQNVQKKRLD